MKSAKAQVTTQILVLLILIVFTSAVVLLLINTGIVSVRAETAREPILNTEFLPFGREGTVVIKNFQFCSAVTDTFECIQETSSFSRGENIHFRFLVETTAFQNQVLLVENYRLKDLAGKVILEVDHTRDLHIEQETREKVQHVYFKDFIISAADDIPDTYTLELVIENPLLAKKTTLSKSFELR